MIRKAWRIWLRSYNAQVGGPPTHTDQFLAFIKNRGGSLPYAQVKRFCDCLQTKRVHTELHSSNPIPNTANQISSEPRDDEIRLLRADNGRLRHERHVILEEVLNMITSRAVRGTDSDEETFRFKEDDDAYSMYALEQQMVIAGID